MKRWQTMSQLLDARRAMKEPGERISDREFRKLLKLSNALCDDAIGHRKHTFRPPQPDTVADREREWARAGMIEMLR